VDGIDRIASWVTEHEALLSGLAAMIAIAAIVPALLTPLLRRRRSERARSSRSSLHDDRPGAKPRIAIFPIQTQPDEPDVETEADRLTEEVTTLLARSSGCDVISRWSASSFAGGGGRAADAGQELGVRYVLEGRMRGIEAGFRVTASLVDTAQDRVVWSDSFESSGDATTDVSRQLGERIASHLGIEIARAEVERAERRPRSREARDLVLAAQGILFSEGHHRHTYQRAASLLEQATTKDPSCAEAYGMLALLFGLGEVFGFFEKTEAFRDRVLGICRRAIEIDDRSSEVLGYVGCAYCDVGHYEQGIPLLERAVSLNPSNAQAKAALGSGYAGIERLDEAIAILENALEISPAFKGIAPWATLLSKSYASANRFDEAAATIDRALRCDPTFFPAHLTAALLASKRGDEATAQRHVSEAYRIAPELDLGTMLRIVGPEEGRTISRIQAGG
jgi:TolB-like protein/Tfp pilus assembly protein PilF